MSARPSHNFNNPYFKHRKPKKTGRFYYNLMILFVVLLAWTYFLFFSSVFQINDKEIAGLEKYNKKEVNASLDEFLNKKKFLVFKFSNIFIFNKEDLKNFLDDKLIFKNISIKKYYPHKIMLTLEEKKEKNTICNENKIFVLAEDSTILDKKEGIENWVIAGDASSTSTNSNISIDTEKILKDISTMDLPPYPIFCDAYYKNKDLRVGDRYPNKKILNIVTGFIDSLHERTSIKVKMAALHKNKISPKIVMYTTSNTQIYLNTKDDGFKQFYKLFLALNNKIKDPSNVKEYIDLRFEDRVYVK